jgi:hypothetical protein
VPLIIKNFCEQSELNNHNSSIFKTNNFRIQKNVKKLSDKKQKNKVELSTEFAISFCLFFNTLSILSILDPLETA